MGCEIPYTGLLSAPMSESILKFVLAQLAARKGQWPQIADESGISYRTLQKIGSGKIQMPRLDKVETLAEYFRKHPLPKAA